MNTVSAKPYAVIAVLLTVAGIAILGVTAHLGSNLPVPSTQPVPVIKTEASRDGIGVHIALPDSATTMVTVPAGTPVGGTIDVVAPTERNGEWRSLTTATEQARLSVLPLVFGVGVSGFLTLMAALSCGMSAITKHAEASVSAQAQYLMSR